MVLASHEDLHDNMIVWTYAVAVTEPEIGGSTCPCSTGSSQQALSFVGNDYYCESGNTNTGHSLTAIYSDDILWDGQQCGSHEAQCCMSPRQPWFYKILDTSTSDGIEIRVCVEQSTHDDENIILSLYEIYSTDQMQGITHMCFNCLCLQR